MNGAAAILTYITKRAMALEAVLNAARTATAAGTYTADQFVNQSASLWIGAVDDWFDLVYPKTLPIKFDAVAKAANSYTGSVRAWVPLGTGPALLNTNLIPVGRGAATTTGISTNLQTDGTVQFAITGLNGQKLGELYQCVSYYTDPTGGVHGAAVLLLSVV